MGLGAARWTCSRTWTTSSSRGASTPISQTSTGNSCSSNSWICRTTIITPKYRTWWIMHMQEARQPWRRRAGACNWQALETKGLNQISGLISWSCQMSQLWERRMVFLTRMVRGRTWAVPTAWRLIARTAWKSRKTAYSWQEDNGQKIWKEIRRTEWKSPTRKKNQTIW